MDCQDRPHQIVPITDPNANDPYKGGVPALRGEGPLAMIELLDKLIVKQDIDYSEFCCGGCFEADNTYKLLDSHQNLLGSCDEESSCCCRNCCKQGRPWTIYVYDNVTRQSIIKIDRPFRSPCCLWLCCWLPCVQQQVTVEAPMGHYAGFVRGACNCFNPTLRVYDENDRCIYRVKGQFHGMVLAYSPVEFDIRDADADITLGVIIRHFTGLIQDKSTRADTFSISFPPRCPATHKALLLATTLLLDYLYFEAEPKKEDSTAYQSRQRTAIQH